MGSDEILGYRTGMGAPRIRNQLTGESRYLPPDSDIYSMKELMQALFDWYHLEPSVIEQAARLHWGIVKIHPFDDGNGRTARLLSLLVLRNHGYDDFTCRALEKYFKDNRQQYDNSLDDGVKIYQGFNKINYRFIDFMRNGMKFALSKTL